MDAGKTVKTSVRLTELNNCKPTGENAGKKTALKQKNKSGKHQKTIENTLVV